jgi:hypothetical protein
VRLNAVFAAAISCLWLLAAPAYALPGNCWGKLKEPLDNGGFYSGFANPTDCSGYYAFDLKYLGRTTGQRAYRVYSVSYTLFAVEGGPGHGVQKILLFDVRGHYVGNYRTDVDERHLRVRGPNIRLTEPARWGNIIRLDGPRPPKRLVFGGEWISFDK